MPSNRERALNALLAALAIIPGASVARNAVVPERVSPGGLIILRDGTRGEPEISLSPRTYHWEHRAVIDVIVQAPSAEGRAASLDSLLLAIDGAITGDRQLGGAVDWAETSTLVTEDLAIPASAALMGGVVTVTLLYDTSSVLG